MKTFKFVGVLVILVLVAGCYPAVKPGHDQNKSKELSERIFEENFSAKSPQTDDERELLQPVVVGKMCEAWNRLVGPQQELAELEAQLKDLPCELTPEDIMKRVELNKQVRSLRNLYRSLVKSAFNAGFYSEAVAMPENGLPSGGDC